MAVFILELLLRNQLRWQMLQPIEVSEVEVIWLKTVRGRGCVLNAKPNVHGGNVYLVGDVKYSKTLSR